MWAARRPVRANRLTMNKYALIFLAGAMALPLPAQQAKFDPTNFIVLGEGLGAGMADYSLKDIYQLKFLPGANGSADEHAFPPGAVSGNRHWQRTRISRYAGARTRPGQDSVRADFPPQLFVFNLSVPGFRVEDSLQRRPSAPIVRTDDMTQTATNLIPGVPGADPEGQAPVDAIRICVADESDVRGGRTRIL